MGLILRIAEAAGITTKHIGSMELIASKDVESFLRTARSLNVSIIGIEGFHVDANHVVPDMDAIADFSGLTLDDEIVSTTNKEARRFFMQVSHPEMYFDFEVE